jgi:hypothetical protein
VVVERVPSRRLVAGKPAAGTTKAAATLVSQGLLGKRIGREG